MILLQDEKLQIGPRGMAGTRVYSCAWSEITDVALPAQGAAWDSYYPYLRCDSIDAERDGPFNAVFTATYSTQGEYGEDFYESSMEFGCEVLDTTRGCEWDVVGGPCDIPVSTIYPTCDYVITIRKGLSPTQTIMNTIGLLNDRKFHGCPAETLLFMGGGVSESYDRNGVLMHAQTSYKFLRRMRSHNEVWREARQKVVDGIPQWYHYAETDDGEPNWTGDQALESTPVYVSGIAGKPGWDKPFYMDGVTKKYRYETGDFATLLGLPIMEDDDEPGG